MFKVKGVKINEVQNGKICQNTMCEIKEFNQSCSVAIYLICYSKLKSWLSKKNVDRNDGKSWLLNY